MHAGHRAAGGCSFRKKAWRTSASALLRNFDGFLSKWSPREERPGEAGGGRGPVEARAGAGYGGGGKGRGPIKKEQAPKGLLLCVSLLFPVRLL